MSRKTVCSCLREHHLTTPPRRNPSCHTNDRVHLFAKFGEDHKSLYNVQFQAHAFSSWSVEFVSLCKCKVGGLVHGTEEPEAKQCTKPDPMATHDTDTPRRGKAACSYHKEKDSGLARIGSLPNSELASQITRLDLASEGSSGRT